MAYAFLIFMCTILCTIDPGSSAYRVGAVKRRILIFSVFSRDQFVFLGAASRSAAATALENWTSSGQPPSSGSALQAMVKIARSSEAQSRG